MGVVAELVLLLAVVAVVVVVVAAVMVLVKLALAVIGTIVVADSQSHCCHRTGTSRSKCGYHMGMQVEARTICGVSNWMDSKS
jgi:hypothetical protein